MPASRGTLSPEREETSATALVNVDQGVVNLGQGQDERWPRRDERRLSGLLSKTRGADARSRKEQLQQISGEQEVEGVRAEQDEIARPERDAVPVFQAIHVPRCAVARAVVAQMPSDARRLDDRVRFRNARVANDDVAR